MMRALTLALTAVGSCVARPGVAPTPVDVRALLGQMSVAQKIGQMTQLDLSLLVEEGTVWHLDPAKLAAILGNVSVGSVLNSAVGCSCDRGTGVCTSGTSLAAWRNITGTIAAWVGASAPPPAIPVLYGVDSVHGANFLDEGVWFQHNIGLAAMWRPDLVRALATVAALDTRSMGASWMFSPVLGLGFNPLWSRFYETPGESPWVGAAQGRAFMLGVADAGVSVGIHYSLVVPTIKHYMGYSAPRSGKDRTDAWIPDAYLKQSFQPAFEAALRTGGQSVMVNSASINGVPATASRPLLTDVLRTEVGCVDCVVLTDWQDIEKLYLYHNLAPSMGDAIVLALDAGVDMSMVPLDLSFPTVLAQLVANGTVPESRLDASVTRILQLKASMGLFDAPATPPELLPRGPWQQGDVDLALTISRESLTLLQNNAAGGTGGHPVLPLSAWLPAGATVLVVGPAGVDIVSLCGGWSLPTLSGGNGACAPPQTKGSSIGGGVAALAPAYGVSRVTILQGVTYTAADPASLANATAAAQSADVVILALGEGPEKETGGDTQDLTLSPSQLLLFSAVASAGVPVVTVLVQPRPRVLSDGRVDVAAGSAALLLAYLPCYTGGQAVAEALFGATSPSGKLPFSYPRTTGDVDVHWHKPWNGSAWEGVPDTTYWNPLFPFGHGLSYGTVVYSELRVDPPTVPAGGGVNVSVLLTHSGGRGVSEAVLLFARQLFRPSITPEAASLVGFAKVNVTAGGSLRVTLPLATSDLAYWTPSLDKQVDAGVYNLSVGGLTVQLTLTTTARAVYLGTPGAWGWRHVQAHRGAAVPAGGTSRGGDAGAAPSPPPLSTVDAILADVGAQGVLDGGPVPRALREARLRQVLERHMPPGA